MGLISLIGVSGRIHGYLLAAVIDTSLATTLHFFFDDRPKNKKTPGFKRWGFFRFKLSVY